MPATPASSTSRCATSSPSTPPGFSPARSFTVTGRPEPSLAAFATATAVSGSLMSAAPAPVFITFGTGQPMFRSRMSAPTFATSRRGRAHDLRVLPEELDRDRPLVGMHDEQLVERLAVAVVDREARDHLGDREPGAVALGLQAHEPVADAGERREHHAVGDRDAAEVPGVVQRAHGLQSRRAYGAGEGGEATSPPLAGTSGVELCDTYRRLTRRLARARLRDSGAPRGRSTNSLPSAVSAR